MTDPPGPGFEPGWQRVVDVGTGAVEDVPAADAPSKATDAFSRFAVTDADLLAPATSGSG